MGGLLGGGGGGEGYVAPPPPSNYWGGGPGPPSLYAYVMVLKVIVQVGRQTKFQSQEKAIVTSDD